MHYLISEECTAAMTLSGTRGVAPQREEHTANRLGLRANQECLFILISRDLKLEHPEQSSDDTDCGRYTIKYSLWPLTLLQYRGGESINAVGSEKSQNIADSRCDAAIPRPGCSQSVLSFPSGDAK